MEPETDILAIGSHPDDIEIAVGGMLIKQIQAGWKIVICDVSNGEPTPYGDPVTRIKEANTAADALGVERVILDLRNRYIENNLESRRKVAEVIREYRPRILLIPYPGGAHPDHHAVSSICEAARFYAKLHRTNMYGQPWPNEPWWTPKMYYYYGLGVTEEQVRPSFIVDISDQWDAKLKALACYESQPGPIKESWRGEEYYGKLIGVDYAEPLFSKEAVGIQDLSGLV